MSSLIVNNLPDYSKIKIEFSPTEGISYTEAVLTLQIFKTKDEYINDTPSLDDLTISGLSSVDEGGKELSPTDFDSDFEKFVDGFYIFTLTFYDGGTEVDNISERYIVVYNMGVMISLNTIKVCRQMEEEDNEHLEDALWAIWGEILLIGIDRGSAVGLISNALGVMDYTNKYLNQ